MSINTYIFGDPGPYDDLNPLKLLHHDDIKSFLLELITYRAGLVKVNAKNKTVVSKLKDLELIRVENESIFINYPLFLDKDIEIIDLFLKNNAKIIGDILINNKPMLKQLCQSIEACKQFSFERIMYHLIGDKTFDGSALNHFSKQGIFTLSKSQPGNRDYIVISYQDSKKIEDYSDNLLCSSNNMQSEILFNSFGDSMGNRNDFFRVFRLIDQSRHGELKSTVIEAMKDLEGKSNHDILINCSRVIEHIYHDQPIPKELEKELYLLESLNYINHNQQIIVPIFSKEEVHIISGYVIEIIEKEVVECFTNLDEKIAGLTAISHRVPSGDIANELWHQLFGNINEYLVKEAFYCKIPFQEGEGRYKKAIYFDDRNGETYEKKE
jgi:hypothetical protein